MQPDQYAETAFTVFMLLVLALGTAAMVVRFVFRVARKTTEGVGGIKAVREALRSENEIQESNLSPRVWMDLVNNRPDQIPHLFIEGGTGAGKTTLTLAILQHRGGPVCVVGVKPDDGWGEGYVYRSDDRQAYLAGLVREVRRRLDDNDRSGLTIVLDDFTRLANDHKEAVELYKLVADVGRSLRLRLILIARGRLVKGLGMSGESDLLDHFVFIVIDRSHAAHIEWDEQKKPIDTRRVREAAQPIQSARWWEPVKDSEPDSDVLVRLFRPDSDPVPAVSPHTDEEHTEGVPATLTYEAIRTLYRDSGWSKNKIAAMLVGSKSKRLAIIDAALAEKQELIA